MQVSSDTSSSDASGTTSSEDTARDEHDISQEDKPRSRIVAEYLAHGYVLSDAALQRAIGLDNQHGISARFTNALSQFDSKYKASDRAKGLDASYGITDKATQGWRGINSYFEKAINTPTGQKLAAFYTQSNRQVQDIHTEARRLADLKSGKGSGSGQDEKAQNEKTMEKVPGTDKTTCQCGGESGACPCQNCACAGCSKAGLHGDHTATGPADIIAASSGSAPLGEKM